MLRRDVHGLAIHLNAVPQEGCDGPLSRSRVWVLGRPPPRDRPKSFSRHGSIPVDVNRKEIGLWFGSVGSFAALSGFVVTVVIWAVNLLAPLGAWVPSIETAGVVLLACGIAIASVGALLQR